VEGFGNADQAASHGTKTSSKSTSSRVLPSHIRLFNFPSLYKKSREDPQRRKELNTQISRISYLSLYPPPLERKKINNAMAIK